MSANLTPKLNLDRFSRESGYQTMYFGRVCEARRRRPLTKSESRRLERESSKLARKIVAYEYGDEGCIKRPTTLDRHVQKFYAAFGLRWSPA